MAPAVVRSSSRSRQTPTVRKGLVCDAATRIVLIAEVYICMKNVTLLIFAEWLMNPSFGEIGS
jgi:hypothetical protein